MWDHLLPSDIKTMASRFDWIFNSHTDLYKIRLEEIREVFKVRKALYLKQDSKRKF